MSNPFPIFDGHNDTILHLYDPARGGGRSFFERSQRGHLDLPRARDAGFAGGFFALYVPGEVELDPEELRRGLMPPPVARPYAQDYSTALAATLFRLVDQAEGEVALVLDADNLARCLQDGVLAMVMHIEGAEAIDPDLDALYLYHRAGLRSLGLVWSRPNAFGTGVPFKYNTSPDTGSGLTAEGKNLVRTCNQLGIMVDLSHLNEKGFWDVAEITDAPLVASHSNAFAVCPMTRNLTDEQLDAIGETGGVVGLNYAVSFLRPDGQREPDTPLEVIVRHADYIAERIGIDHVALGSDFDGAIISKHMGDVTGLPRLLDAFQAAGYDDQALRKITHENWLRVLRATWKD